MENKTTNETIACEFIQKWALNSDKVLTNQEIQSYAHGCPCPVHFPYPNQIWDAYLKSINQPERSKREDSQQCEMRCSEHCGNTMRDK